MRTSPILTLAIAAGAASAAFTLPKRPVVIPAPYDTGVTSAPSPPRDPLRVCRVKPSCTPGRDDAPKILAAFQKCNDGGTVVLDKSYLISTPLDLRFLKHVDVAITGEVAFNDEPFYWEKASFKFVYQNTSAFWVWGGEDVNIYGDLSGTGKSLIDGRAQKYWEEFANNKALWRPVLFATDQLKGATISNLRMRNPPNWFNLIANSSDIIISNLELTAESQNNVKIGNSDGWDTYRADNIVIQNSIIKNTDDCVSFKPNSTNVIVQNLDCTGSHGISVGSLGQYNKVIDIVENLYIYNIRMANASDGARIKVWPGIENEFEPGAVGGGGLGRVKNVTWDGFYQDNIDRAITITQCYNQANQTLCKEYPSELKLEDITLKNFWGQTSKAFDPEAGALICSAPDTCSNVRAENITITVPSGNTPEYKCRNLDESLLGFKCKAG